MTKDLFDIGWEEWVSLPDLGILAVKAKVDTGAKTSALHAFYIDCFTSHGKNKVRFGLHPIPERPEIEIHCTADILDRRTIISSNGESELRYIIQTLLQIGDKQWPIELSLTNRETMVYRMLLGRSAMEKRVTIRPHHSCLTGEIPLSVYDPLLLKKESQRKHLHIGILSREKDSYSTQRIVEAAESRGHTIEVIHTTHCYMNIHSLNPQIYLGDQVLQDYDAIIPRIGSSITFYGLAVVRQFEAMGVYCLNASTAIRRSRDKLEAHQALTRAGLDMPVTSFAYSLNNSRNNSRHLLKLVGGAPVVIKLLEGTQGRGVLLAETPKAAESVIDAFQGLKVNILVQEYIKEAKGADIRCFVIGSKVVAAMQRKSSGGDFRSNLHQGGIATKVRITAQERAIAVKAVRTLGLKVAGVDLIRTSDGPKVLEVNSSPGLEGIEKVTGKDIAGEIIHYIEKHAKSLPKLRRRRKPS